MKTVKTFLVGLMTVAIFFAPAGCSKIDNEPTQTIPFSVIVGSGTPETRATVDADNKTLRFAAGDVLYIASDERTDLKGTLTLKAGDEGKDTGATFEGTLTYTGAEPADDLTLKATLVGGSNAGIGITDGKVTGISYPADAFCSSVNDAVEKYSLLTGTSTYAARSFTLSQGTAFLNFSVALHNGTSAGTAFDVTIANGGADIATASVTTANVGGTATAQFVLPVAAGTVLSGATVTVGNNSAVSFGGASDKTLEPKVYSISRDITATLALSSVTSAHIGWRIGSDGYVYYPNGALPSGISAVAMICMVSGDHHGMAIELNSNPGTNSQIYASSHPTSKAEVPGLSHGYGWYLPTVDDWYTMIASCNGESHYPGEKDVSSAACTAFVNKYNATGVSFKVLSPFWTTDFASGSNAYYVYVTKINVNLESADMNSVRYYLAYLDF